MSLTSPLFPYTTLFRSALGLRLAAEQDAGDFAYDQACGAIADGAAAAAAACERACRIVPSGRIAWRIAVAFRDRLFAYRDRKSIRLNSSHLGISYDVLC